MHRLAADANFNNDVLRGLKRQAPELDVIRVADIGQRTAEDTDILAWAADEGRILITHDRATVPRFAYERVRDGLFMPGVFVIRDKPPMQLMIDEVHLVALASMPDEWK